MPCPRRARGWRRGGLGGMTGGPGDTAVAAAAAAGRTRSSALGQTRAAAREWAEQAAAGPGSAGPRGRAQEGGLVGHARAGLRGGVLGREGGRSGPRCWWAEGGFPLFFVISFSSFLFFFKSKYRF